MGARVRGTDRGPRILGSARVPAHKEFNFVEYDTSADRLYGHPHRSEAAAVLTSRLLGPVSEANEKDRHSALKAQQLTGRGGCKYANGKLYDDARIESVSVGFCKVIVSETATQNWIMTAQKANCRHQCLPPEGSRPWIDLEVPVIGALDAMNAIFLRLSS